MKEVTLKQAKEMTMAIGQTQSIPLLASPSVGKSDIVRELSRELEETQDYGPCQTLLGTQIAPEVLHWLLKPSRSNKSNQH